MTCANYIDSINPRYICRRESIAEYTFVVITYKKIYDSKLPHSAGNYRKTTAFKTDLLSQILNNLLLAAFETGFKARSGECQCSQGLQRFECGTNRRLLRLSHLYIYVYTCVHKTIFPSLQKSTIFSHFLIPVNRKKLDHYFSI